MHTHISMNFKYAGVQQGIKGNTISVSLQKQAMASVEWRHSRFLLSEHILCKESIVIVKKFDFEILSHLYVLRSPEFIYAIFGVMYECVCMCVCV